MNMAERWWAKPSIQAAVWMLAPVLCGGLTALTDYKVHDGDSRLYAAMSADMAQTPVAQWAAPEWRGHWKREGLFYEHPPGMLWAGAAFCRLGFGPFQAVYMVNFVCYCMSVLLLFGVARRLGGDGYAATAVLCWVLTPAFIQYLVRGNQEHPVTLALVLSLFALLVANKGWVRSLLWGLALAGAIMVKGVAGLGLIPVAVIYLLAHERKWARFLEIGVGSMVATLACLCLELWHADIAGVSFWTHYFGIQVGRSVGGLSGVATLLTNLVYYMVRPAWFFFPGILLVGYGLWLWHRDRPPELRAPAWHLGLITAVVYIGGFSLADRKAGRYIFPAYPVLALSAAWVLWHLPVGKLSRWRGFIERSRPWLSYGLMLFVLLAVAGKIYMGTFHYRFIRLWPDTPEVTQSQQTIP